MESENFRAHCSCTRSEHEPRFIAITGGPGAGKSALLALARRHFCAHVEILPETASLLYRGGFPRAPDRAARHAIQRAIFHVQSELERMAAERRQAAVVLCDRGTIDGSIYWLDDMAEYWRELGTTREEQLRRYVAVIHLRTPGDSDGYDLSNPVRIESAHEARRLDDLLVDAWRGHPRRMFIEPSPDFLGKVTHAVAAIRAEVPSCCSGRPVPG